MSDSLDDMVVLRRHADGTPAVWCDPEIADIVGALNNGGVPTRASCSGHGKRPGNVALADGRELIVAADWHEARNVEAAFPPFTNPDDDRHQFEPVDTPDLFDPHTCQRCGEGRFHPSHVDPREGLDPDEQIPDGGGACPGPAPPQTAHDDAPHPNCPECGHEADSRSRAIQAACDVLANEQDGVLVGPVERAIDAALASGWVLTYEAWVAGRDKIAKHAYHEGRNDAEAQMGTQDADRIEEQR